MNFSSMNYSSCNKKVDIGSTFNTEFVDDINTSNAIKCITTCQLFNI